MSSLTPLFLVAFLTISVACGDDSAPADTGTADTGTSDTGGDDAGEDDAGEDDAGGDDAGGDDASADDAGGDDASADAATGTPCGTDTCDPDTEICFECACGGPTSFSCMAVPEACSEDRTCTCIGPQLCTSGLMECTDRGDNHVFCDTGLD